MELLDRQQVAQMLKTSPEAVYRLTVDGTLPAYKVGKRIRYEQDAVIKALKGMNYEKTNYRKNEKVG